MGSFEEETKQFIYNVKHSDIYVRYYNAKEAAKKDSDIWNQIALYRSQKFELQNYANGDELFDRQDVFERNHSSLLENDLASEFLDAELALCRMLQKISMSLMESLDFE